jgi:hypothetical protein
VPAKSEPQRRLAGADLARKRAGKPTVTGMTTAQLRDFARKPVSPKKRGK